LVTAKRSDTENDYYGAHASDYARYRPTYPPELFSQLLQLVPHTQLAWDCGTGNGQVAVRLAEEFTRVFASDLSSLQLEHAPPHPKITYKPCPAHQSGLADGSVGLITVATAVHWFDLEAFFAEAERVLSPGGVIAVWTYAPDLISPAEVGELLRTMAGEKLARDWPPGIEWVNRKYRDLPFPFSEIPFEPVDFELDWSFSQLYGWVDTWSAVRRYRRRLGSDPLLDFRDRLEKAWHNSESGPVRMPLYLRVGRKG
jgi:SAM-dependent methyltransferase